MSKETTSLPHSLPPSFPPSLSPSLPHRFNRVYRASAACCRSLRYPLFSVRTLMLLLLVRKALLRGVWWEEVAGLLWDFLP